MLLKAVFFLLTASSVALAQVNQPAPLIATIAKESPTLAGLFSIALQETPLNPNEEGGGTGLEEARSDYVRWLSHLLDDHFLPGKDTPLLRFRRKVENRDLIYGQWQVEGLTFTSAQTGDFLALVIQRSNGQTKPPLKPMEFLRRKRTFSTLIKANGKTDVKEISVQMYGDFLRASISHAATTLFSEEESSVVLANSQTMAAYILKHDKEPANAELRKIVAQMAEASPDAQNEPNWYRRIIVVRSAGKLGLGFHKAEVPTQYLINMDGRDWF